MHTAHILSGGRQEESGRNSSQGSGDRSQHWPRPEVEISPRVLLILQVGLGPGKEANWEHFLHGPRQQGSHSSREVPVALFLEVDPAEPMVALSSAHSAYLLAGKF